MESRHAGKKSLSWCGTQGASHTSRSSARPRLTHQSKGDDNEPGNRQEMGGTLHRHGSMCFCASPQENHLSQRWQSGAISRGGETDTGMFERLTHRKGKETRCRKTETGRIFMCRSITKRLCRSCRTSCRSRFPRPCEAACGCFSSGMAWNSRKSQAKNPLRLRNDFP